jgi:glycosyltransferase involved in cell wall biosynthesis
MAISRASRPDPISNKCLVSVVNLCPLELCLIKLNYCSIAEHSMPRQQKPTILQVIPKLETGGAERTTVDIGNAIAMKGWTSLVVSEGGRLVKELEEQGTEHIELPMASKNPFKILINAVRLIKLIKTHRISLLHARSRAPAWSALIAARYTKTPYVTTYHGAYKQAWKIKALYNSVMVRSDITIANSQFTRKFIEDSHPNIDHRIVVIYRGTDFSAFQRQSIGDKRLQGLRDQWNIQGGGHIVLCLARLTGIKGQSTLIQAMPEVLKSLPQAVLVLAGDDQGRTRYRKNLERQIVDLGLEDKILLPGHCSDPAAACALSDLVIMASTEPETFGRTVVEAQAVETPVIVTDIGAVGETVLAPPQVDNDARTGWRVPPGNATIMAQTIVEVLTLDRDRRNALSKRAQDHVLSHFSIENMCNETLNVYTSLLEK